MYRSFIAIAIQFFLGIELNAQNWIPFREENLWGYADGRGKISIAPFLVTMPERFVGEFAIAKDSNGYFLLSKKGEKWLDRYYSSIERLDKMIFRIGLNGQYGLWSERLGWIYSIGYAEVKVIGSDFFFAKGNDGRIHLKNRKQKWVIPADSAINEVIAFNEGMLIVKRSEHYGAMSIGGKWLIYSEYDYLWPFSEGLAAAVKEKDSLYVYLNKSGKIVLKSNVPLFNPFREGLAVVYANGVMGAVDKQGRIIIPYEYNAINDFVDGWALVEKNNFYNYINPKGGLLLDSFVDNAIAFSEQRAAIASMAGKWALIDKKGKALTPFNYDYIEPMHAGMTRYYREGGSGFLNKNGKEITSPEFDTEKPAGNYQGGDPIPIQFNEGMAVVSKWGKYGYINKKGRIVVPLKYDAAQPFKDGYALIVLNGKYGYINRKGKEFFRD